jgi:hypothetical protein
LPAHPKERKNNFVFYSVARTALRMLRRALLLSLSACAASAAAPLPPLAWAPLPHGTLAPEGWLARQLQIQGAGMAGHFTGTKTREQEWFPIFSES